MEIVLCITGASGAGYGITLLEYLQSREDIVVHLVVSDVGKGIIQDEVGDVELAGMCEYFYENSNMGAVVASGSVNFDALVIAPATMSTVSKISTGISDNLITRLGAVALKERRKFVVVPRETPISTIHLENLARLSQNGVIVMPASPGFYNGPEDIQDLVNNVCSRVLDIIGVENELAPRYGE